MACDGAGSTGLESTATHVTSIGTRLQQFREAREEEGRREFQAVATTGIVLFATSLCMMVLLMVLVIFAQGWWIMFLRGFSFLGMTTGLCVVLSCPIDLDKIFHTRPGFRISIFCFLAAYKAIQAIFQGDAKRWLSVLASLLAMIGRVACLKFVGGSFWACLWTTLDSTISAVNPLLELRFKSSAMDTLHWQHMVSQACCYLSLVGISCGRWAHSGSLSNTSACIELLQLWFFFSGLCNLLSGLLRLADAGSVTEALAECFAGCQSLPVVAAASLGRPRLFQWSARRFNRGGTRSRRDGAFVAALLDGTTQVSVGQQWWILDVLQDDEKVWRPGVVVELKKNEFVVALRGRQVSLVTRGSLRISFGAFIEEGNLRRFPRCDQQSTADEMMEHAEHNLRCLDWSNLTLELLHSSSGADAAALSKKVLKASSIDFFLSHSWHDNPEEKYEALQQGVRKYTALQRRVTFWFDKACIDQAQISDGLRALPVNIMACKRVLVLCGPTYLGRLWCVWELFILLVFRSLDQVLDRLVVLPLNSAHKTMACASAVSSASAGVSTAGRQTFAMGLADFQLSMAHCFDPNEEARLRSVIAGMGEELFTARIREIGSGLNRSQVSLIKSGSLIKAGALSSKLSRAFSVSSSEEPPTKWETKSDNVERSQESVPRPSLGLPPGWEQEQAQAEQHAGAEDGVIWTAI